MAAVETPGIRSMSDVNQSIAIREFQNLIPISRHFPQKVCVFCQRAVSLKLSKSLPESSRVTERSSDDLSSERSVMQVLAAAPELVFADVVEKSVA